MFHAKSLGDGPCGFVMGLCTATAQGQVFSQPTNVSQNPASDSVYPAMIVDSAGNIDVAWVDSASGINFARSTNAGLSFLPAVRIGNVSIGVAFQPQIAVDPTGTIIEIAWAKPSAASGAPAGTFDVFVSQLTIGAVITTPVSTAVKLVDSPRLAFDGTGVDVVWGNTETWISHSPNGTTFNAPINLSIAPQDSGGPRVAVDKSGNIFVAWTDRLAEDQNKQGNFCTNPTGTTNGNGIITVFSNTFGGNYYLNETPSLSTPNSANTRNLSKEWVDQNYPAGYFGCSYDSLHLFFDQKDNLHLLWADEAPLVRGAAY